MNSSAFDSSIDSESAPTAMTRSGLVRGEYDGEVCAFRGIPYAKPPFGDRRFSPPERPDAWKDIRNATEFGPAAPQPTSDGTLELLPAPKVWGEDCLTVNVWSPKAATDAPVMVFLHGGAFVTGGGSVATYDGAAFARDGVVLVTLNYRLGVEGFLYTGEGHANLGILDQIAALEWVRDNISNFGGDAGNVTLFGESAGAMSACTLMTIPRASSLFHRVIAESGAGQIALPKADALRVSDRLAEILGVPASRAALKDLPIETVLAAQAQLEKEVSSDLRVRKWGQLARTLMPFEPVIDGDLITELPQNVLARGEGADVDLMIGTNSEETNLFFVPGDVKLPYPIAHVLAHRYGGRLFGLVRSYHARGKRGASEIARAVLADAVYRVPALQIARAHPRSHVYQFTWRSPAFNGQLGACHALELPFVFDTLDKPGLEVLLGDAPPQDLASEMHSAWVRFAKTGNPGWADFTRLRPNTRFFGNRSRTGIDDTVNTTVWRS